VGVGGIVYLTSPVATSLTLSLQLLGDYTDYGQRAKHSIWEDEKKEEGRSTTECLWLQADLPL